MNEQTCKEIHDVLHYKEPNIRTSIKYKRFVSLNGCRAIKHDGILFMEQNPKTSSRYAKQARDGKHITWGIRPGKWIYIDDEGVRL